MANERTNDCEEGVILNDVNIEEIEEVVAPGFLLSA